MRTDVSISQSVAGWVEDSSPFGLFTTDTRLEITTWNNWLEKGSGWNSSKVTGKNLLDLYPELVTRKIDRYFREALEGRHTVLSHAFHRYLLPMQTDVSRNATVHMPQMAIISPRILDGQICGTVVYIEDASDRIKREKELIAEVDEEKRLVKKLKSSEQALRESEERFRTVADFTYDWEYWIAPDGHYIYVSPSCERITGYSSEEFMNDHELFQKIVHPNDQSAFVSHICQLEQQKRTFGFDFRIITRSGEERWINHVCQSVYGSEEEYLGQRASNRDISKQKLMQEKLQQANKMDSIATLAGGIAHEFNNALMAVLGNIELLKMELPEDERKAKHLEAMNESGHRMSRLTDQLLAYAQGGQYEPRDLKLDDFIIETLPILQHDLSPEVRVETHLPKDISYIGADNAQMHMVLSAILANSIEAVEDEGIIKITAENKDVDDDFTKKHPGLKPGSYVCLTIEDDGKGMDEETKDGIFEPFFTTKFQGRGMGMAAVYGIIKSHNGWIYVDSELRKGTVVHIYLPAIEAKEEVKKEVGPKPSGELATGEGTILVIEDEEPLVMMFRQILERLGYRVLVAMTGKDAIELAKTFDGQIDLALLDINLPDMEGGRVYPLIMEARPDLKVIVWSGYSILGPAQAILDAGAEGFIQKLFFIAPFAEKLKEVLEGK